VGGIFRGDYVARTIRQLFEEARGHIMDVDGARYSDVDFLSYLNDSMYEIRRLRPDAFFGIYDTIPQFDASQLDEEFPLDGIFINPVVYFLAGSASLRDDEHVSESRAMGLLAMFSAKLVGSRA
jgi:hypothetical protein